MRVFVACEFSGAVRDAFRRLGHDAWSCDLEGVEPEGECPNYHLFGDARWFLDGYHGQPWDLLIAHPPCTYLANSGVKHLYNGGNLAGGVNQDRWAKMLEGAEFFREMLDAPIPRKCIENPIVHRWAKAFGPIRDQDQIIQPWMFGHGETKATCLWLENLPKLTPTNIVEGREARVHRMSPGPNRWKERSRTLPGIAAAMASQWGAEP